MIGGSGNGEQIAANKVNGVRCALAWSEETAVLAREHNDANVISVGGRMHSAGRDDALRRDLPRHRRSPARSGTPAGSPARRLRDHPRAAAAARVRAARRRRGRGRGCLRGTPSAGSPTTSTDAFAGRPVRVSSPQGRFAADAALLDGQTAARRRLCRQAPVRRVRRRAVRPRPPRADRQVRRPHRRRQVPPPVGQVRLRLVTWATPTPETASYADLRGATQCDLIAPREARRDHRAGSARTRCAPTPTREQAWRRISRSHRPIGDLLMDQEVLAGVGNVYRAEVLFRHRLHPLRPGSDAAARPVPGDVGRPGRADGRGGRDRAHRHGAPRAHARGDGPTAAGGRPRRRGLRLPSDRTAVPRLRHKRTHRGARGTKLVLVPGLPAAVPLPGDRTREGTA